jgi:hypothetical protein
MAASKLKDPRRAIGRSPDALSLEERLAFAGKHIALEIYTPETLPLRRIEAIGNSLAECLRMLQERGLDPKQFEFQLLPRPY